MIQRLYLILKEIFSQKLISIIVFITILITVLCVGFFEIIGANFNQYINKKFATNIPPNFIQVTEKKSNFRKKNKTITDKSIKLIQKIEGVKKIHSYTSAKFPVQAEIDLSNLFPLLQFNYRTDLILIGAPYSMVKKDINNNYKRKWRKWNPSKKVPFLIPQIIIDAYNQSLAEANNLPKINKNILKILIGTNVDLNIGQSSINRLYGSTKEQAELAGITKNVTTLAMVVPLNFIKYYNLKLTNTKQVHYIYTYVEVKDHEAVINVSNKIQKMGYNIETEIALSKELKVLKTNVNLAISLLMVVIAVIAVIAISVSTVIATLNRTEYYRIMRILGASKIYVTFTILIKYAIFGYIGSNLALLLIKYFLANKNLISFVGHKLVLSINKTIEIKILFYGTLIPVISTLPALIKLYTKSLNRE